jgi:predicted esterase
MDADPQDPHRDARILTYGPPPAEARLTMLMVHGRGASADDILGLAAGLGASDIAFLAPNAAGRTWYPYSFLTPIERNEPFLTSALALLARIVERLAGDGIPRERVGLAGFSQGACLALEFAARHAGRYAAIAGLSGGLIGPPGTPRQYPGTFGNTPVFLGCSDVDSHVPVERVHETTEVLRRMGAQVDERIYRGMAHTINQDEIDAVRAMLR